MGETDRLKLPYPELNETGDVPRDMRDLALAIDPLGTVPVGALMMWMTAAAPQFWLLCDGGSYTIATWPQLGALLGENPSGSGNFRVPDLLGRVPLGVNAQHPLAQTGGAETVALTTAQLPAHKHTVNDPAHAHGASYTGAADRGLGHAHSYVRGDASGGARGTPNGYSANAANESVAFTNHVHTGWGAATGGEGTPDHLHGPPTIYGAATGISLQDAGSGATHENLPPYLAVNFIIRAG